MYLSKLALYILLLIFFIGWQIGMWGIFKKAGLKPWKSLIPLYNIWLWIHDILERKWWWMLLTLIPYMGIFMFFLMIWETLHQFKKYDYGTLILGTLFFFVYLPYVGFSKKETFVSYRSLPVITKSSVRSWIDALIFAVAAAYIIRTCWFELYEIPTSSMESSLMVGDFLTVNKMAYGVRLPNTPLAIPFIHNKIPLTKHANSYVRWVNLPYMRSTPLNPVKNNDVVVFNYSDGDTVALERLSESYYAIVREFEAMFNPDANRQERQNIYYQYSPEVIARYRAKYPGTYYPGKGRDVVWKEYKVIPRPVDKRENYVKRCVAIPGDVLQIIDKQVYINGKPATNPKRIQYSYIVSHPDGLTLSKKRRKALNINEEDVQHYYNAAIAVYRLTDAQCDKIRKWGFKVDPIEDEEGVYDPAIFPHSEYYSWNKDYFGPLTIPAKGQTVSLNEHNIVLYDKIIRQYEHHELTVRGGKIFIDGKVADSYTFAMDYYFMMGDNRHNSADSRFWGFVPEDHIVGKPSFVWLSVDKYKSWGDRGKIRLDRMFRRIRL